MGIPRTVLLVEHSPELRDAMAAALRRTGYEVVSARDADEADDFLAYRLPDLLVSGMMLTGRSGFQVVRLVKERSDGRVPAIMTSGRPTRAHRDYAFALGTDAYLAGPFSPAELTHAAEELCPLPTPEFAASA